jgi:hypothetical protein
VSERKRERFNVIYSHASVGVFCHFPSPVHEHAASRSTNANSGGEKKLQFLHYDKSQCYFIVVVTFQPVAMARSGVQHANDNRTIVHQVQHPWLLKQLARSLSLTPNEIY